MNHLIILHGAVGSAGQLENIEKELKTNYIIHNIDLPGHGNNMDEIEFSIENFTSYVKDYCDKNNISGAFFLGYSMGGYVSLYLAYKFPSLVSKVITLATKFEWALAIAEKEIKMLQPEVIEQKLPGFAKKLEQRHSTPWKIVLNKTSSLLKRLGEKNILNDEILAQIDIPVLVMAGDRDKMISMNETISAYKKLPNGYLAILPSTPHPIEQVDVKLLVFLAGKFFGQGN